MEAADLTVYYNPHCSKCRQVAGLLAERGLSFHRREYLTEPPDHAELESLLAMLGTDDPATITRTKEAAYAELGLAGADRAKVLEAIATHPRLLERPIVVRAGRAIVARPPEVLLDWL